MHIGVPLSAQRQAMTPAMIMVAKAQREVMTAAMMIMIIVQAIIRDGVQINARPPDYSELDYVPLDSRYIQLNPSTINVGSQKQSSQKSLALGRKLGTTVHVRPCLPAPLHCVSFGFATAVRVSMRHALFDLT
jgi:hypothetical protein